MILLVDNESPDQSAPMPVYARRHIFALRGPCIIIKTVTPSKMPPLLRGEWVSDQIFNATRQLRIKSHILCSFYSQITLNLHV